MYEMLFSPTGKFGAGWEMIVGCISPSERTQRNNISNLKKYFPRPVTFQGPCDGRQVYKELRCCVVLACTLPIQTKRTWPLTLQVSHASVHRQPTHERVSPHPGDSTPRHHGSTHTHACKGMPALASSAAQASFRLSQKTSNLLQI